MHLLCWILSPWLQELRWGKLSLGTEFEWWIRAPVWLESAVIHCNCNICEADKIFLHRGPVEHWPWNAFPKNFHPPIISKSSAGKVGPEKGSPSAPGPTGVVPSGSAPSYAGSVGTRDLSTLKFEAIAANFKFPIFLHFLASLGTRSFFLLRQSKFPSILSRTSQFCGRHWKVESQRYWTAAEPWIHLVANSRRRYVRDLAIAISLRGEATQQR